jgi:hypothetical protein
MFPVEQQRKAAIVDWVKSALGGAASNSSSSARRVLRFLSAISIPSSGSHEHRVPNLRAAQQTILYKMSRVLR